MNEVLPHLSEYRRSAIFIRSIEAVQYFSYLLSKLHFIVEYHPVATRSLVLHQLRNTLIAADSKTGELCAEHVDDFHGKVKAARGVMQADSKIARANQSRVIVHF